MKSRKARKDRWVQWVQSMEVNLKVQECQKLRGTGGSGVVAFGDNVVNSWFHSREIAQTAKGRQNPRQMYLLFTQRGERLNLSSYQRIENLVKYLCLFVFSLCCSLERVFQSESFVNILDNKARSHKWLQEDLESIELAGSLTINLILTIHITFLCLFPHLWIITVPYQELIS